MKRIEDLILETFSIIDEKDTSSEEIQKQDKVSSAIPKHLKKDRTKKSKEKLKGEEIDIDELEDEEEDEKKEEPDVDDTIINFKNATVYDHFKDYAVNQFRAGKSLEKSDEVEKYFNRLSPKHKKFFFFVFRVLTQIMDGVSGEKAPMPDKYFKLNSKTTNTEKSDSKSLSKKLGKLDDEENAKVSDDSAPIVVGESQNINDIKERLQKING